jgi:hypothetical protein
MWIVVGCFRFIRLMKVRNQIKNKFLFNHHRQIKNFAYQLSLLSMLFLRFAYKGSLMSAINFGFMCVPIGYQKREDEM